MKNIKSLYIVILSIFLLILPITTFTVKSRAQKLSVEPKPSKDIRGQKVRRDQFNYKIKGDKVLKSTSGTFMVFDTYEGMTAYFSEDFSKSSPRFPGDKYYPYHYSSSPIKSEVFLISHEKFEDQLIGTNRHLTAWAKATSYYQEFRQKIPVSKIFNYGGNRFEVYVSLKPGVILSLAADSNRDSRPGIAADIEIKRYKVVQTNANTGEVIREYYFVTPKVLDVYNKVVYK